MENNNRGRKLKRKAIEYCVFERMAVWFIHLFPIAVLRIYPRRCKYQTRGWDRNQKRYIIIGHLFRIVYDKLTEWRFKTDKSYRSKPCIHRNRRRLFSSDQKLIGIACRELMVWWDCGTALMALKLKSQWHFAAVFIILKIERFLNKSTMLVFSSQQSIWPRATERDGWGMGLPKSLVQRLLVVIANPKEDVRQ